MVNCKVEIRNLHSINNGLNLKDYEQLIPVSNFIFLKTEPDHSLGVTHVGNFNAINKT